MTSCISDFSEMHIDATFAARKAADVVAQAVRDHAWRVVQRGQATQLVLEPERVPASLDDALRRGLACVLGNGILEFPKGVRCFSGGPPPRAAQPLTTFCSTA